MKRQKTESRFNQFMLFVNQREAQVDVLSGQQLIAVIRIWQREFLEQRFGCVGGKLKFVDDWIDVRLAKRTFQRHVRQRHGTLWKRFQNQLVAESSNHRVKWVLLVLVDARLHGPLKSMGSEAVCFIKQLRNEVFRAFWQQLNI